MGGFGVYWKSLVDFSSTILIVRVVIMISVMVIPWSWYGSSYFKHLLSEGTFQSKSIEQKIEVPQHMVQRR